MSSTTTVGMDIGGTKVLVVRVTDGRVVAEARTQTATDAPLTPEIFSAIREVWTPGVLGIGAGVAGLVDAAEGRFVWGPHVAGSSTHRGLCPRRRIAGNARRRL